MKFRGFLEGALFAGGLFAALGGIALGALRIANPPDTLLLQHLEEGYRHIVYGFLFLALLAVAAAALTALAPKKTASPQDASEAEMRPSHAKPDSRTLYQEMKTYVDLEMWDLAREKADLILERYPESHEAQLVAGTVNELRWKAEPKYVDPEAKQSAPPPPPPDANPSQIYHSIRTYIELEMWELARQKALLLLKNFPEAPEAEKLAKDYKTLERKAREAVSPPAGNA